MCHPDASKSRDKVGLSWSVKSVVASLCHLLTWLLPNYSSLSILFLTNCWYFRFLHTLQIRFLLHELSILFLLYELPMLLFSFFANCRYHWLLYELPRLTLFFRNCRYVFFTNCKYFFFFTNFWFLFSSRIADNFTLEAAIGSLLCRILHICVFFLLSPFF